MTQYLYSKESAIVVTRASEALDSAEKAITEKLNDSAIIATRSAYSNITAEMYDNDIQITEEAANDLFVKRYLDILKKLYNSQFSDIKGAPESMLPKPPVGRLYMDDGSEPLFVVNDDSIIVKDIKINYTYNDSYSAEKKFDVMLPVKRIVLYDENPVFFEYALAAGKGIYITGQTSTVFGNVYAGTHEPMETRKAEALYGERELYGGVNINATQIAFVSDKIVTNGAINMKGSFVLFGNDEKPAKVYAKKLSETDIIASRNTYEIKGSFEELPDDFDEIKTVKNAMSRLDLIDGYYDSANDGGYMGSYRKVISMDDITVKTDVEGVIITPKNVIIEEGVNIVGIVVAGDRIYIQGNNNIVGSSDILRKIVKEELHTNDDKEMEYMHIHVSDYIGGIEERGIK